MIPYDVISTGSKGNAVVLGDSILIDCGVPWKLIAGHVEPLKLVLLTHIHGDHFKPSTLRRLSIERPTLRFGCCHWLAAPLSQAGVKVSQIDVYEPDKVYNYGTCSISPVALAHNVPNCGYRLFLPQGRVFYATDTGNLDGITAKGYDLLMVEANHTEAGIRTRIDEKRANGEYAYEVQAMKNHLSVEQCNDFVYSNLGPGGEYVYLHCHEDKEASSA